MIQTRQALSGKTDAFDLIVRGGPEYIFEALIKDFVPLSTVGESSRVTVLLRGQKVIHRKPDNAGPHANGTGSGYSQFLNYQETEAYFSCPTSLEAVYDVTANQDLSTSP